MKVALWTVVTLAIMGALAWALIIAALVVWWH